LSVVKPHKARAPTIKKSANLHFYEFIWAYLWAWEVCDGESSPPNEGIYRNTK